MRKRLAAAFVLMAILVLVPAGRSFGIGADIKVESGDGNEHKAIEYKRGEEGEHLGGHDTVVDEAALCLNSA